MIRLSEKIDSSVTPALTSRIARNVPSTVVMPTASGISAAIRPRKTHSDSRKRIGNASSSARARSSWTWVPTSSWATSPPPTVTPGWRSSRCCRSTAASASSTPSRKVAVR